MYAKRNMGEGRGGEEEKGKGIRVYVSNRKILQKQSKLLETFKTVQC